MKFYRSEIILHSHKARNYSFNIGQIWPLLQILFRVYGFLNTAGILLMILQQVTGSGQVKCSYQEQVAVNMY